jgi:hypothetical protein
VQVAFKNRVAKDKELWDKAFVGRRQPSISTATSLVVQPTGNLEAAGEWQSPPPHRTPPAAAAPAVAAAGDLHADSSIESGNVDNEEDASSKQQDQQERQHRPRQVMGPPPPALTWPDNLHACICNWSICAHLAS